MRKPSTRHRPHVLIVHARGEWSGLPRLPKLCRAAGASVSIFAPPGCSLWKAAYIEQRLAAPRTSGAFAEALRAHLAVHRHRYDWVLVGDENAIVELTAQRDTGWLAGWFPVDPAGPALQLISSKVAFAAAAHEAAVPMPASRSCNTLAQTLTAAGQLGYPVMLKAAHGYAGLGVRRANSPADIAPMFEMLATGEALLVQKFEVGRVGSSQIFFDRGRLAGWNSSYKRHVFPEPFGPSSARVMMTHPDMRDALTRLGRLTGFHGLCAADWIHRESDGGLLLLEFNPRPAPGVHLGTLCGVDFAAAIADSLAGRFNERTPQDVGPREVYLFPQHLIRCIEMRKWRDLKYWLPFSPAARDVPWDQPRLLFSQLMMLSRRLTRAIAGDAARAPQKVWQRFTKSRWAAPVRRYVDARWQQAAAPRAIGRAA